MRGARGGGLGVPLPPELAFANSQVPSTLCNPATHFSKPCDTGHISALSFLLPLGAPQEGMARPGCAARLHRRRQEAAATGSSGMRARGAGLAQSDVHPSELPPRGIPPCASPGKLSTGGGGVGSKSRLCTQGCLSGTAGQVGAVLSAPTAQRPPQTLHSPPISAGWLP